VVLIFLDLSFLCTRMSMPFCTNILEKLCVIPKHMESNYTVIYSNVDKKGIIFWVASILLENIISVTSEILTHMYLLYGSGSLIYGLNFSDRLNTRNMLQRTRNNIGNNFSCPLYNSDEEQTLEHLFFIAPLLLSVRPYCIYKLESSAQLIWGYYWSKEFFSRRDFVRNFNNCSLWYRDRKK
jgi:hypothetical protein